MTINVGRGVRQQSSILRPMNSGMAHVARQRLTQYVGMANAQNKEAIKVDGVDAQIWIRGTAGRACSCRHPVINTTNSLKDYTPEQADSDNPFNFKLHSPLDMDTKIEYKVDKNEIETDINLNDNQDKSWLNEFDLAPDQPLDLIEEDNNIFNVGNTSLLFGGDKSPCAICYGTGWTSGYRLINGDRIIADSSLPNIVFGAYVDKDTHPYSFVLSKDINAFVEFELDIPLYFKQIINFSISNNCIPIYAVIVASKNGKDFEPLTLDWLQSCMGKTNHIWIRVLGDFTREIRFTHVEINYQLADFPKLDLPPFARQENYQYFEALQTMSFEVNGEVPYLDRECVIGEVKNGFLWKVVSSTQHMDSLRQLFKTEIEARLIQRSEALFMLNMIYRPLAVLNYRGLERIQGLTDYINRSFNNLPR